MIKNSLIIVLVLLLAGTSFLLYKNKNISIVVEDSTPSDPIINKPYEEYYETEVLGTVPGEKVSGTDIKDELEPIAEDGYDPYLDPTVRLTINEDREIVTDYKIIGPRKFSLLTKDEEPMVEIDLETGQVKINPEYSIDDASKEFWRYIGKTYPEVCFVE